MIAPWLLVFGLPVAIALLLAAPGRSRSIGVRLAPAAAIPGLILALTAPPEVEVAIPWLLLNARFGLDTAGQLFLFFTAMLWTLASIYARAYMADDPARARFAFYFLLTMSGNLGLTIAFDAASFYLFFALMTFSAYGLVAHSREAAAFRAGRIYIAMAVGGEASLIAGILLAVASAGTVYLPEIPAAVAASPYLSAIVALLLAGFGIKAGAIPLHMWLPLAHPVAPTPASAVLSGSMIKAGLLGWIRFLPFGEAELGGWGTALVLIGLAAAFFGVMIGLTQVDPKTNLAYSSISQMGIVNSGLGIALVAPEAWPLVLPATLVFAAHHAFAKGALFLGVGLAASELTARWQRNLVVVGLVLGALALAGAPLTSGAVAKGLYKTGAVLAPIPWPGWLDALLPLTSVGTSLLMGRFLFVTLRQLGGGEHAVGAAAWIAWSLLLVCVGGAAYLLPDLYELEVAPPGVLPIYFWASLWPVLVGILLLLGVRYARQWLQPQRELVIEAGDILIPIERLMSALNRQRQAHAAALSERLSDRLAAMWKRARRQPAAISALARGECILSRWETAGGLVLVLIVALLGLLYMAGGQG